MHIEQALDFIHACPPAKFEGLSDLLSPELVQACLAETGSVSLRRRRMPMERVLWAIIGIANSTPKCNTSQIKQPVVVHQTRSAVA